MIRRYDSFFLLIFFVSVVSCSQENPIPEVTCGVESSTQGCSCGLDLMGIQTCTERGVWSACACSPVADMSDMALEFPLFDIGQDNGGVLDVDMALFDSSTQEMGTSPDADLTPDETSDVESDVSEDIPVVGDMSDAGEVVEDVGPGEDLEPGPVIDCAAVALGGPPEIIVHDTLKAYHGLAFDTVGNYYGAVDDYIYSAPYGEFATPFGGSVGWMEQLERLPDGDLVACGDSAVYRISTETGGNEVLSTAGGCYGIRVGPDGMVYTGDGSRVYRIDPETGIRTTFVSGAFDPRVMDFSPDASRMYIGIGVGIGDKSDPSIWYVDLDEEMNVISTPARFYEDVGGFWMDGLAVDICGNVYVTEYFTGGMYRISPDATEFRTLWSFGTGGPLYAHGIMWGSGVGGWDDHSIFVPLPYNDNKVGEVYIGIPYRTWEGTVLNRRPML